MSTLVDRKLLLAGSGLILALVVWEIAAPGMWPLAKVPVVVLGLILMALDEPTAARRRQELRPVWRLGAVLLFLLLVALITRRTATSPSYFLPFLVAAALVDGALPLASAVRWMFARKRAGAILVSLGGVELPLTTPSQVFELARPVGAVFGCVLTVLLLVLFTVISDVELSALVALVVGLYLLSASVPVVAEPFRTAHQGGIVAFPFVVPWVDVVGFDWSYEAGKTELVLRTNRRQRFFDRSVSVDVSPDRKAVVDALLRQRVGPGPA